MTVGIVLHCGTIQAVVVSPNAETVYQKLHELLQLPDSITMEDWFVADNARLWPDWYTPEKLQAIGIDPNGGPMPEWYNEDHTGSAILTVEVLDEHD